MNQPFSSPNHSPQRQQPQSSPQPRRPRKQRRTTPLQKAHNLRPLPHGPLPLDPIGQRLAHLFPNGWNWIYSPTPQPGDKPQWETIKPFPLAPIEMWDLHQDPNCPRPSHLSTGPHQPTDPLQTPQQTPMAS